MIDLTNINILVGLIDDGYSGLSPLEFDFLVKTALNSLSPKNNTCENVYQESFDERIVTESLQEVPSTNPLALEIQVDPVTLSNTARSNNNRQLYASTSRLAVVGFVVFGCFARIFKQRQSSSIEPNKSKNTQISLKLKKQENESVETESQERKVETVLSDPSTIEWEGKLDNGTEERYSQVSNSSHTLEWDDEISFLDTGSALVPQTPTPASPPHKDLLGKDDNVNIPAHDSNPNEAPQAIQRPATNTITTPVKEALHSTFTEEDLPTTSDIAIDMTPVATRQRETVAPSAPEHSDDQASNGIHHSVRQEIRPISWNDTKLYNLSNARFWNEPVPVDLESTISTLPAKEEQNESIDEQLRTEMALLLPSENPEDLEDILLQHLGREAELLETMKSMQSRAQKQKDRLAWNETFASHSTFFRVNLPEKQHKTSLPNTLRGRSNSKTIAEKSGEINTIL